MAVKGGNVAAVRVGDCLELLAAAARTRATNDRHAQSPLFYQLLRAHGDLGPDAPAAIEMFFGRGQPSCEQLIDRYRIACRPVRDVLVDYLRERQPAVDFSIPADTWPTCSASCFGPIWRPTTPASTRCSCPATSPRPGSSACSPAPEDHHGDGGPGQTGRGWTGAACSPRYGPSTSIWPSGPTTTRPAGGRGRCAARSAPATPPTRRTAHTASPGWTTAPANGCRCCRRWSPGWTAERARTAELLAAAEQHPARRAVHRRRGDPAPGGAEDRDHRPHLGRTRDTGRRRDLSFEEHRGFWTWAVVEVLRHTGIRIEELTELSHHSLIQYRLPATGELIPLLQITRPRPTPRGCW